MKRVALLLGFGCLPFTISATSLVEGANKDTLKRIEAQQQFFKSAEQRHFERLASKVKSPELKRILRESIKFSAVPDNGDEDNPHIDCKTFHSGIFSTRVTYPRELCQELDIDLNNNQLDYMFFYHPKWMTEQVSPGQAYKFAVQQVAMANEAFNAVNGIQLNMVGFEQPTFEGYRDFDKIRFEGFYDELLEGGYQEFPLVVDFDVIHSPTYEILDANGVGTGNTKHGFDRFIQTATEMTRYVLSGDFELNQIPRDSQLLLKTGSDIYSWGRLPEPEYNDGADSEICGIGGGAYSLLMLESDSVNRTRCQGTLTHEIGHGLNASHNEGHQATGTRWARARAVPCGDANTIMHYANASNRLDKFSSPNLQVNGEVCGNEVSADNARQVELSVPFASNYRPTMKVYGDVWFANGDIDVSENDDSVTFNLQRNGDLTKPTTVKVFIDNGYTLLASDFIEVAFSSGESAKALTLNVINNDSTAANPELTASLVLPLQLSLTDDKNEVTVVITNDDTPPKPLEPPVVKPEEKKSSGGAVFWLMLAGFVGLRRKL
ncbi:MAG: hypothetical protein HAW67_05850 [Endozoicomonadaceae bacterium]|nr:hypothetical protein [Endozoicomonadaceae bacterium]